MRPECSRCGSKNCPGCNIGFRNNYDKNGNCYRITYNGCIVVIVYKHLYRFSPTVLTSSQFNELQQMMLSCREQLNKLRFRDLSEGTSFKLTNGNWYRKIPKCGVFNVCRNESTYPAPTFATIEDNTEVKLG